MERPNNHLTIRGHNDLARADVFPALVGAAGKGAKFAYEEFFHGKIRNPHTRKAYRHAVHTFLARCEQLGLELSHIAPAHVGRYLDVMQAAPATKKLHLAALRHFFDELVTRHVMLLNPAATVRGQRHQVIEGKTPEISVNQARKLLATIDTSHVVGLRDRAIIATLIYTAARVGAIAGLQLQHFIDTGEQYCLRFTDKGGKSREIPVRHDLQIFLSDYVTAGEFDRHDKQGPLFRTTVRRTRQLTNNAMTAIDMTRMVKRRLHDADLPPRLSPHSCRVATLTNLLEQGVPLADVQYLAGHADPRTTRLYDRRQQRVTRNIVERISI